MHLFHASWLRIGLLAFGLWTTAQLARAADFSVEQGTIGTAKYTVAVPAHWNGKLILLAHGLRPDDAPLSSDFDFQKGTALGDLVEQGWMIASTSYRRNGWLLEPAIEDIEALRKKVTDEHGAASTTLVIGTSMGGAIGTVIAETADARNYQGVLALSAGLGHGGDTGKKFTHDPRMPLLFLSNRDEAAGPRVYVAAAVKSAHPPVLWTVERDGHANFTQAEYTEAVQALLKFCATGKIEANKDATLADPVPASKAVFHGGNAVVSVTGIDPVYGNITTNMVGADLEKLGLKKGDSFEISFGQAHFRGFWVSSYGNVPKGEWLAFVTAGGTVQFARNMANAAQVLGVKAGDSITVSSGAH